MCRGPGAVLIATRRRLGWEVLDAVNVVSDEGKLLQLSLDSPAAVANSVNWVVKRWRWRNHEKTLSQPAKGDSGAGALMAAIWKLLNSKQNDEEWNPTLREGLRSAFANRQYTQVRVVVVGWALHDSCLLCLHDVVDVDRSSCSCRAGVQQSPSGGSFWHQPGEGHTSQWSEHKPPRKK